MQVSDIQDVINPPQLHLIKLETEGNEAKFVTFEELALLQPNHANIVQALDGVQLGDDYHCRICKRPYLVDPMECRAHECDEKFCRHCIDEYRTKWE
jgi:hypothetical protein